jgi:hypothetical protein
MMMLIAATAQALHKMPRRDARRGFELPKTSRPAAGTISFVTVFS